MTTLREITTPTIFQHAIFEREGMMKREHSLINKTGIAVFAVLVLAKASAFSMKVLPPDSTSPPQEPMVVEVYRLGHENDKGEDRISAGIDDIIVVKVRNLQTLVARAKCLDENGQRKPECVEQEIALYLEGRRFDGLAPEAIDARPESETLQFHLRRNEDNDEAWADLLGAPPLVVKKFYKRSTQLSVGLDNGYVAPSEIKGEKFKLIRVKTTRFWICSVGLFLLLFVIVRLARRSDILRDAGPDPIGTDAQGNPKRKPYSLSRCQLAFWFFLVIASFLLLWQITGAYDIITTSILALIGIGSGTALGAAIIDSEKKDGAINQFTTLQAEQATLNGEVTTFDTQMNAGQRSISDFTQLQGARGMKQTRLNVVSTQMGSLATAVGPQESHGFLRDVLSDETGVSFHRLQMFVWTIVLGVIFISSVWSRLAMPEFSTTLLALQGLSAGTYLGFKLPEKRA